MKILPLLFSLSLVASCASTSAGVRAKGPTPPLRRSQLDEQHPGVSRITRTEDNDEYSPAVMGTDQVAWVVEKSGQYDIMYMKDGLTKVLRQTPNNEKAVAFYSGPPSQVREASSSAPPSPVPQCVFVDDSTGYRTFQIFKGEFPVPRRIVHSVQTHGHVNWPTFSPDGNQLLFSQLGVDGKYELWLSDLVTGDLAILGLGQRGRWSPDGKEIVYTRRDAGHWDIWRLDFSDGRVGDNTLLVRSGFDSFDPVYSPDGQWIAYTSNETGSSNIVMIDAKDPTIKVEVTKHGAIDCEPEWSRDGQYIYFASDRFGTFDILRIPMPEPDSGGVTGQ